MMVQDKLITPREVKAMLAIGASTLDRLVERGVLKVVWLPTIGHRRFRRSDVHQLAGFRTNGSA